MIQTQGHTDIRFGWVDRFLPPVCRPYARLARLDRPTGTWLLLFPCWWGVALANEGRIDWWLFALLAVGALVMRGAGCTLNDILDRHLDARVERTRHRPLPSRQVTVFQALLFMTAQMLIGLIVLLQFNKNTVLLGMSSLVLVAAYPLMKRITWWPQAFLGVTFNWGGLVGWMAVRGRIEWPAVLLYVAGFFWTLGYDTIYARQDIRDDKKAGIKSTTRLFGDAVRYWVGGFYILMVGLLMAAGVMTEAGFGYYIGLMAVIAHLAWQVSFWMLESPADALEKFRTSRWTGWLVLFAILLK